MINSLIDRNKKVIRDAISDIQSADNEARGEAVDAALDYFERKTDHADIRGKMKQRFAKGITKTEGDAGYETYSRDDVEAAIDAEFYEVIPSGIGNKIIDALATLFTNETQSWNWINEADNGAVKNDDVAQAIQEHREAGNFDVAMASADSIAVAIDSGPVLIRWHGGHLKYKPFSPACLYAKYSESGTIIDDGEERGVDYTDLEDATVVVVKLSETSGGTSSDAENSQFIAFFGRSEKYPNGRQVVYRSKEWDEWPSEIGPGDTVLNKKEYNPLSALANSNSGYIGGEYPIIILKGGITITPETFAPTNTSLYESCIEIDLAYSRVLKDALNASRGKDIITSPLGEPLPRSLEGAIALNGQQTFDIRGRQAVESVNTMIVVEGDSKTVAGGFGVPGYMVVNDGATTPQAGIALAIRTAPLIEQRDKRIKHNRTEVRKLYHIERGLIEIHSGSGLPEALQVWNPGRVIIPQTEKEKTENITAAMDKKLMSYVRGVRDFYNLPDDEAAEKMIELIEKQSTENPPPGNRRVALPVGVNARAARPPFGGNEE